MEGDLLFRLGKTEEAEACVRRAAAIDPAASPNTGRPNSLLGQILHKKGDAIGARNAPTALPPAGWAHARRNSSTLGCCPRPVRLWSGPSHWCPTIAFCKPNWLTSSIVSVFRKRQRNTTRGVRVRGGLHGRELRRSGRGRAMLSDSDKEQIGMEILNRTIMERPTDAEAFFARGRLNQNAGRSREVVSDYRQAATLDPRHVIAFFGHRWNRWHGPDHRTRRGAEHRLQAHRLTCRPALRSAIGDRPGRRQRPGFGVQGAPSQTAVAPNPGNWFTLPAPLPWR